MALIHRVVHDHAAQLLHGSVVEILFLGNTQHLGSVSSSKEFAFAIQQFQCVPLCGVVAGSNDDATVGLMPTHGQFGSRCRGQTDVNNFVAHAHKSAANHVAYHGA